MGGLTGLVASVASADVSARVKRTKRSAIVYAVAGVLLSTTYVFALVAIYYAVLLEEGPVVAALVIAVGAALVGIVALVALAIVNRIERRREQRLRAARELQVASALSLLSMVGRSPLILAAGLGALAFLALAGSAKGGEDSDDEGDDE